MIAMPGWKYGASGALFTHSPFSNQTVGSSHRQSFPCIMKWLGMAFAYRPVGLPLTRSSWAVSQMYVSRPASAMRPCVSEELSFAVWSRAMMRARR